MPIAGTIEHDDPVLPGRQVDKPAGDEVLDHAAVAMQQDQRRSLATFQVMEADPVHLYEPADRGIALFGPLCKLVVDHCRGCQSTCNGQSQPPLSRSFIGTRTFDVREGLGGG